MARKKQHSPVEVLDLSKVTRVGPVIIKDIAMDEDGYVCYKCHRQMNVTVAVLTMQFSFQTVMCPNCGAKNRVYY